jgi:hypothetical protein
MAFMLTPASISGLTAITSIDTTARKVIIADGATISYERLLLATGAEPIRLPIPGAEQPHVHTLRSLSDCRAIIAEAVPFFRRQHYDVRINYIGHAEQWDEIVIDDDIAAKDCLLLYKNKGRARRCLDLSRSCQPPRRTGDGTGSVALSVVPISAAVDDISWAFHDQLSGHLSGTIAELAQPQDALSVFTGRAR